MGPKTNQVSDFTSQYRVYRLAVLCLCGAVLRRDFAPLRVENPRIRDVEQQNSYLFRQLSGFLPDALPLGAAALSRVAERHLMRLSCDRLVGERPKTPRPAAQGPRETAEAPVARKARCACRNCLRLGQGGPRAIGLVPHKGHRSAQDWGGQAPPR